jgi:transcriptional regulator with XRE-family HTH domain
MARAEEHEVNEHLGQRLYDRRRSQGLTQSALANAIGVSARQVQRYESGANQIVPSRLVAVAASLDVDVGYFFEKLVPPAAADKAA